MVRLDFKYIYFLVYSVLWSKVFSKGKNVIKKNIIWCNTMFRDCRTLPEEINRFDFTELIDTRKLKQITHRWDDPT